MPQRQVDVHSICTQALQKIQAAVCCVVLHRGRVIAQTLNIGTPVVVSVSNMPSVESLDDFVADMRANGPVVDNECLLYLEQKGEVVVCTNEQNAR